MVLSKYFQLIMQQTAATTWPFNGEKGGLISLAPFGMW